MLSKAEYEKIMNKDIGFLMNTGNEVMSMFYSEFKNDCLQPKVIVDYQREAYILNYEKIRITLDKGLKSGGFKTDIFDKDQLMLSAVDPAITILEVKYNNFLPSHIKKLIQIGPRPQVPISKYVVCREMLIN